MNFEFSYFKFEQNRDKQKNGSVPKRIIKECRQAKDTALGKQMNI